MKKELLALVCAFVVVASTGCAANSGPSNPTDAATLPGGAVDTNQITLAAIEPEDGAKPVTDFIDSARQSLDIVMYEFNRS